MSARRLSYDEARAFARAVAPLRRRSGGEQPDLFSRSERDVLAFLAWGCWRETGEVRRVHSTEDIARGADCSVASVKSARRRLVAAGLLEVLKAGGGSQTTRYRVALERGRP